MTEPELQLLPYVVRRGETAVDAGANYGLYCIPLSRLVGPGGRVHAFEPGAATSASLRRVLRLLRLRNVRVTEAGLSDYCGWTEIVVPSRPDGRTEPGRAWTVRSSDTQLQGGQPARMARLDDVLRPEEEVAFLKCDIEGAELFALRGAERVLSHSAPTLILEVSRPAMGRYGVGARELKDVLAEHGYATYRYDPGSRVLIRASPGDYDGNLVAVHPRRADRLQPLGVTPR